MEKAKILRDVGNTYIDRPTKLTMEEEEEYLSAIRHLSLSNRLPEDFTLDDAVRFAASNYRPTLFNGKTIKEVGDEWEAELWDGKRDENHINECARVTGKLADAFGEDRLVCEITTEDIRLFLTTDKSGIGPLAGKPGRSWSTRKNLRTYTSMFFNFAKYRRYVVENPINKTIKMPEKVAGDIEFLTNTEVRNLLDSCLEVRPELTIPYFALATFAGIRPEEMCPKGNKDRLTWDKIVIREKGKSTIEIKGSVGKTKGRRVVELTPNCIEWIRPYVRKSGPVIPLSKGDWRCLFDAVRIKSGYSLNPQEAKRFDPSLVEKAKGNEKKWIQDGLRHTAITYYLVRVGNNEYQAAAWAGNSPEVIQEHYDAKVTGSIEQTPEEQYEEFYAIEPKIKLVA